MGTLAVAASRRSVLQISKPSISGNITSRMIRAGVCERAFFNASAPSAAVVTA